MIISFFVMVLVLIIALLTVPSIIGWADLLHTHISKSQLVSTLKPTLDAYDWSIVFPLVIIASETNFGNCYYYNLFNITTDGSKPYFIYPTIPNLKFCRYSNYQESIDHFWRLLKMPLYAKAFQYRKSNVTQAIVELIKAGYSGADNAQSYINYIDDIQYLISQG